MPWEVVSNVPVDAVRKSWPIGWRGNQTNPNKSNTTAPQKAPRATKPPQKTSKKTITSKEIHQPRYLKIRDINQRTLPLDGKTMTNVYPPEPDHPLFDVDTATHWIYPTSEIFERRQYQVFCAHVRERKSIELLPFSYVNCDASSYNLRCFSLLCTSQQYTFIEQHATTFSYV